MKNWDKHFPWNGYRGYFECPDELRQGVGFCGHPSLIKMEYVKNCAPHIIPEVNPEKQFHGGNGELLDEVVNNLKDIPEEEDDDVLPLFSDINHRVVALTINDVILTVFIVHSA